MYRNNRFPNAPLIAGNDRALLQRPPAPIAPNDPQGNVQRYSSAQKLGPGDGQVLVTLYFPEPRAVGIYIAAPYIAQQSVIQNLSQPIITNVAGNKELWILGTATVGMGGTSFAFSFDIPLNQVTQLQLVGQTIEVKARLILAKIGAGGGGGPAGIDFSQPDPIYTGDVKGGNVYVQGFGGEGFSGLSNPTRRARFVNAPAAPDSVEIFPPPFATRFYAMANVTPAQSTANQSANNLTGGPVTTFAANQPLNTETPIIDNCDLISLTNTSGGTMNGEVIFKLGFGGQLS